MSRTRGAWIASTLIDRIERVELRVTDIGRALSFYEDVVGLRAAEREPRRVSLTDGERVLLVLDANDVRAPADPRATGLFHVAIRFPTRPALGDVLARLLERGLEVGAGDHLVSEALYVGDPDGNGIELYRDRPQEQWPPPTKDMMVPMKTLPVDLEGLLQTGSARAAAGAPAPLGTDIGHVHLQVGDIERSVGFYRDALGLDLAARMGHQAAFFSSNGYHHHVGANVWRSRGAQRESRERAGLERVVFAVSAAEDVARLRDRLDGAGYAAVGSNGSLTVRDPDSIELQFAPS